MGFCWDRLVGDAGVCGDWKVGLADGTRRVPATLGGTLGGTLGVGAEGKDV